MVFLCTGEDPALLKGIADEEQGDHNQRVDAAAHQGALGTDPEQFIKTVCDAQLYDALGDDQGEVTEEGLAQIRMAVKYQPAVYKEVHDRRDQAGDQNGYGGQKESGQRVAQQMGQVNKQALVYKGAEQRREGVLKEMGENQLIDPQESWKARKWELLFSSMYTVRILTSSNAIL